MNWEVLHKAKAKKIKDIEIADILLKNRGLNTKRQKDDFLNPNNPEKTLLDEIGLDSKVVGKAITRIKTALKKKEKVFIYGDYDADGICATAILWETLYALKLDVNPYIPDRFSEGYGLNEESIERIKKQNPALKLIITVDNGIVAYGAVRRAKKLGIDVIVTDHHQKQRKKLSADFILHTTDIGGAALSWFFAREIERKLKVKESESRVAKSLELAAIGTIADQIPLLGINRSIVKFGLAALNKTERVGILSLISSSGVKKEILGIYDVNFIIAPRINAMGRLKHGLDSLRLLCTTDVERADSLSKLLGKTNKERQKIVEEVFVHARRSVEQDGKSNLILVAHESYHEGVIGLAASNLVEKYYRPSIVISLGKEISKASARSIPGFNIIEAINSLSGHIEEGGGHPMAAGFSIKTEKLKDFHEGLEAYAKKNLKKVAFNRKIKVDMEMEFENISESLIDLLKKFEPAGIGNPRPLFLTKKAIVLEAWMVGKDASHLKLRLGKNPKVFEAIAFGFGKRGIEVKKDDEVDVVYSPEENIWNGRRNLQLKVRDIKVS